MPHMLPIMGIYATPHWGATVPRAQCNIPNMGNRLKALRVSRGWTQEEAAKRFGLSKSGYIKIERSERKLATDRIEKAKAIYGVSGAEVIGDESAPSDKDRQRLIEMYDQLPSAAREVAIRQLEDLVELLGPKPKADPEQAER